MRRSWIWFQLVIGWVPIAVLIVILVLTSHRFATLSQAIGIALRMVVLAGVLGLGVVRLVRRWPWPHRVGAGFVLRHFLAASGFALLLIVINSAIESIWRRHLVIVVGAPSFGAYFVTSVWFYVMIAGVSYASEASVRVSRAEALAAKSQLAALRAQLNPHFLFNALHTVVQLIPSDPARASSAAEQVADLLRATLEENRDLIPLEDELSFVRRYLCIERIRFGDRLVVQERISDDALGALVPVFAVQTLVENAVRHGAAPRVDPTTIELTAAVTGDMLTIAVRDNGDGASLGDLPSSNGTGLNRLRERLAVLYEGRARLDLASEPNGGFAASFVAPFYAA